MDDAAVADDLARIARTGLTSPHLFDVYGRLDKCNPAPAWKTPEIRAYEAASQVALRSLQALGCRSRSGTHYRIGAAILLELQTAKECRKCGGSGWKSVPDLWECACPACFGSGIQAASIWWRADACECRRVEFRDNVHPAYIVALSRIALLRRVGLHPEKWREWIVENRIAPDVLELVAATRNSLAEA